MNQEEEHQSRYDRGSTIMGLGYIGLMTALAVSMYHYADDLQKHPEKNPSRLEEVVNK